MLSSAVTTTTLSPIVARIQHNSGTIVLVLLGIAAVGMLVVIRRVRRLRRQRAEN